MTDTVSVGPGAVAKLVVSEGDGACVVVNKGPYTVFFGDNNAIRANDQSGVVAITINSYISVTGDKDLYACVLTGQTAALDIISGAVNFFLPLTSLTIPYGSTGARVVINPPSDPGAIVGYDNAGNVTFVLDSTGLLVGPTTGPQVQISGGNPATVAFPLNDAAFVAGNPVMFGKIYGAGANRYSALVIQSPTTILAAHDDYIEVEVNSPNADGSSTANFSISYIDSGGVSRGFFIEDYRGVQMVCWQSAAMLPGTGTSAANPAQAEGWHAMTTDAGWAAVVNYLLPSYRLTSDGMLQLAGCVNQSYPSSGSKQLNGSNPLPAAYRPPRTCDFRSTDVVGNRCHMALNSAGVLTAYPPPSLTFPATCYAEIDAVLRLL